MKVKNNLTLWAGKKKPNKGITETRGIWVEDDLSGMKFPKSIIL